MLKRLLNSERCPSRVLAGLAPLTCGLAAVALAASLVTCHAFWWYSRLALDGSQGSTVTLKLRVWKMHETLSLGALVALSLCAGALIITRLCHVRSQQLAWEPMSLLLDTVRRVIRSGDYSLRAVQGPGGGVAELAAGLNTLLDQIELRDIQIKAYREELDEKIRIRTEVPKAKEAAVRLETSLSPTAPRSRKTPPQLAGIRALLVDDNITNVALLREALTRFGMQCDAALSGREALFLIQGNLDTPYDVAVLELVLPGMDGLELARVIKADPANAGLRLMMLTGFGKDCDLDEVIAAGIDYYMERPVCIERICDGIAFLTGRADDSAPWSESHPIAAGTTLSALGEGGPKGNYSG